MVLNNVDDKLITLFQEEWIDANTSHTKPTFIKVTDTESKVYDFSNNEAVVLMHRPVYRPEKNGIDRFSKRLRYTVRVDLRILGKEYEQVFLEMYNEIIRILDKSLINPFDGFNEINYEDQNHIDLSDRNKGMFRVIIPVECINYCVARGN